ncbi:MAG: hypothetical protein KJ042_04395 [Deltaproteobacteria bacterium]|nr:hypothetical protein [Deltaproteobacteria bacterium]
MLTPSIVWGILSLLAIAGWAAYALHVIDTIPIPHATRPHGVSNLIIREFDQPSNEDLCWPVPCDAPLFAYTSVFMRHLGRSYQSAMRAQVLLFTLLALVLSLTSAHLGGTEAGFWAALLSGSTPLVILMTVGFDDHLFNSLCVAAGAALIIVSKGLTRVALAPAIGLCFGVATRYAFYRFISHLRGKRLGS